MSSAPKNVLKQPKLVAGFLLLVSGSIFWLYQLRTEEIKADTEAIAEKLCVAFINENYNDGSRYNPAFSSDLWWKRSKAVVEVGLRETKSSSSYRTYLCIYDPIKGDLFTPGAFGRSDWEDY